MILLELGWIDILIPDWAKWMAIDEDGSVYVYKFKPSSEHESDSWDISNNLTDKFEQIMTIPGKIFDWDEHLYILEDVPTYKEHFQQILE